MAFFILKGRTTGYAEGDILILSAYNSAYVYLLDRFFYWNRLYLSIKPCSFYVVTKLCSAICSHIVAGNFQFLQILKT